MSDGVQQPGEAPRLWVNTNNTACFVYLYPGMSSPKVQDGLLWYSSDEQLSALGHVTAARWSNALNTPGGGFSVTLKASPSDPIDITAQVAEDDWIDIVIARNGIQTHAYRGCVQAVSRALTVQNGVTSVSYTIVGASFSKPLTDQPVWFDDQLAGISAEFAAQTIFAASGQAILGSPAEVVGTILGGYFIELRKRFGHIDVFTIPKMPGEPATQYPAPDGSLFNATAFWNFPPRHQSAEGRALAPSRGTVWDAMTENADLMLCELFCDLGPTTSDDAASSRYFTPGQDQSLGKAKMQVYFRSKPFLRNQDAMALPAGLSPRPMLQQAYIADIPQHQIAAQDIVASQLAKSGAERKNIMYFTALRSAAEQSLGVITRWPIADTASIAAHGLRPLYYSTKYGAISDAISFPDYISNVLSQLRDLHGLNHHYLSGSITLVPGRPEIRIGSRILVSSTHKSVFSMRPKQVTTSFYVETVQHSFNATRGLTTQLGVSHGFAGSDAALVAAIRELGEDAGESKKRFHILTAPGATAAQAVAGSGTGAIVLSPVRANSMGDPVAPEANTQRTQQAIVYPEALGDLTGDDTVVGQAHTATTGGQHTVYDEAVITAATAHDAVTEYFDRNIHLHPIHGQHVKDVYNTVRAAAQSGRILRTTKAGLASVSANIARTREGWDTPNQPVFIPPLTIAWKSLLLCAIDFSNANPNLNGTHVDRIPRAWAVDVLLATTIYHETHCMVGRPNYTLGAYYAGHPSHWHLVWEALIADVRWWPARQNQIPERKRSRATGLGQLIPENAAKFQPGGCQGYGNPFAEAVGLVRYMRHRYGITREAIKMKLRKGWW